MPRAARAVADGVPHHITQRGNNRQDVFLVDQERRFYLETLAEDEQKRLRGARYAGMPLGSREIVAGPERRFHRRLTLRGPAPQPKTKAASF